MHLFSHLEQLIFNLLLLVLIVCGLALLNKNTDDESDTVIRKPRQPVYRSFHLACLLEDAPPSSLKGQSYELAIPLMTPFACIVPQTWQYFYTYHLAQPGINYWTWQDKPESHQVCPALADLFSLNEPQGYAKEILESLALRQNPFFHPSWNRKNAKLGNLFHRSQVVKEQGKFAEREFRIQLAMRDAFKQWHQGAIQKLGKEKLTSVYQRCYGVSWDVIQEIMRISKTSFEMLILEQSSAWWEILGVSFLTRGERVEKSYYTLVRFWHPDRNSHPNATEVTIRLNLAYQQYQALPQAWPALRKWHLK
ncbi:hypothetical protein C7H19_14065 [Aphanothece hegewaldii CCALA 016]|uniref:J domain-containing protein n=1 Tax=Aphanothece hegewaldii CCALA 016 TaxID=2107694 RepID=A0A2T1LWC4_9CHRO|nr:J domain-containing protein [Aphanothece hegewaldii]PSF36123.1 hypothetical protein C7H19_14065 [Aphanothece hegewaldii CCALA 016]